jgi:site-specific recombinase XerD
MGVKVRWKDSKGGIRSYYLDIHHEGRRKRVSIDAATLREANQQAAQVEHHLIREGWPDAESESRTLDEFTGKYLTYSRSTKAYKTYLADLSALKLFQAFTGDLPLAEITGDHLERFRMHELERVKATSCNVSLRHLKAAFSWATEQGFIEQNPAAKIKLNRVPLNTHPKFLSAEDIQKLRNAAGEDSLIRRVIDFGLWTGMRRDEIVHAQWSDVDLERGTIVVQSKEDFRTKSRRSRIVPMNTALRAMLTMMRSAATSPRERLFSISYGWLGKQFKAVVRKAGLSETTSPHVLRHTLASHLIMNGVDLASVQQILGHHSVTVTMIYSHLDPNYLAKTVEKLPY